MSDNSANNENPLHKLTGGTGGTGGMHTLGKLNEDTITENAIMTSDGPTVADLRAAFGHPQMDPYQDVPTRIEVSIQGRGTENPKTVPADLMSIEVAQNTETGEYALILWADIDVAAALGL